MKCTRYRHLERCHIITYYILYYILLHILFLVNIVFLDINIVNIST